MEHIDIDNVNKGIDVPLIGNQNAEYWVHTPQFIAALRKVFRKNYYLTRWDVLQDKSVGKMKVMVVQAYSYCDFFFFCFFFLFLRKFKF